MSETSGAVDRLMWVTRQLRRWCPWTRELTHAQLAEYLIEEAHETVEVIETLPVDDDLLRKEFGDVLFQVVLHSALAEERIDTGAGFTLDTVAAAITEKMVRRNPHVFSPDGELLEESELGAVTIDEVEKNWERIKQAERVESAGEGAPVPAARSIFDLPAGLPALAAAAKAVDRAGRQSVNPLPDPPSGNLHLRLEDEQTLGEDLFALVQTARARGLDPERALREHLRQRRP